jgi:DinB superfamily
MIMTAQENDVRPVLSRTPSILRALLEESPAAAVDFHEKEGAWSPVQVLCHLAHGEVTDWMARVELILAPGDSNRFTPFDREGGFVRYAGWTASRLLDEFDKLRASNLARLDAFNITEADLRRTAVHPDLGTVTLGQLLACWATHDLAHIEQITRGLVRYLGPAVGPWRKYFSLLSD